MLDTFKSRLRAKYPGVNLSQARIDAIAARLHKKFPEITEEADHDEKIGDYYDEESIKEIAKQDDQLRTLQSKQPPPKQDPPPKPDDTKDEPKPAPADMPDWFKPFADEIMTTRAEKKKQALQQKLKDTLKDVPEKFWSKRVLPDSEEAIEAFTTEVVNDYKEIVPATDGFTPGRAPGRPPAKPSSDKQIQDLVDNIMGVQPDQK